MSSINVVKQKKGKNKPHYSKRKKSFSSDLIRLWISERYKLQQQIYPILDCVSQEHFKRLFLISIAPDQLGTYKLACKLEWSH